MARKPRVHFPGAFYHVIIRGNNRKQIFFTDNDRKYFYSLLEEGVKRFGYEVHGFCLMSNHVHLAIHVGNIPLSKIIQNLSFRYTRWINYLSKKVGHLFQGRYKAILVEEGRYLLTLIRYIHLNPVRANMVNSPEDYLFSSCRAYLGFGEFSWLTTDLILGSFSNERSLAMVRYCEFMQARELVEDQTIFRKGNQKGYSVLGSDEFVDRLKCTEPVVSPISLDELIHRVCHYYSIEASRLLGTSRDREIVRVRAIIAVAAQELRIATIADVARRLNRDATGLGRKVALLDRKGLRLDPELISLVCQA